MKMENYLTLISQNPELALLWGMLVILFILKLIPDKKTSLQSFEPPERAAGDNFGQLWGESGQMPASLFIPLTAVTDSIRFEARFNIIYKFVIFGLPVVIIALFIYGSKTNNDLLLTTAIVSTMVYPLCVCVALYILWAAKRRVRKLVGDATPAFVLDAEGITVPLLLVENDRGMVNSAVNRGQLSIRATWKDIGQWLVYSNRSYVTQRMHGRSIFQYWLRLDNPAVARGAPLLRIRRRFTAEEERKILAFAGKYLKQPVQFMDC